jgi:hypothetical protein
VSELKRSRWRPAAAIGVLVAVAGGWLLLARDAPDAGGTPPPPRQAAAPPAEPPPTPAREALDRAELIAAAARAANAFARGEPAPEENIALAGRRFVLVQPFGCGGPASSAEQIGAFGWAYDAARGTLRARATPEIWTEAPWAPALADGREVEAIEGFWIRRPWIREAGCPAVAAPPEAPPTPPAETVGIARLFAPDSQRARRRNGAAYEVTAKAAPDEVPGADGLRLVIEGRLAADPARQPVSCWAAGPDQRPVCILVARIERVAITRADGTTTLAEWAD